MIKIFCIFYSRRSTFGREGISSTTFANSSTLNKKTKYIFKKKIQLALSIKVISCKICIKNRLHNIKLFIFGSITIVSILFNKIVSIVIVYIEYSEYWFYLII